MFVRRKEERIIKHAKAFNGQGEAEMQLILNSPEEMYGKGRLFNHIILNKGCEVGEHTHHGDGETYYIIKGEGQYNNNGEIVTLRAGDLAFVGDGETHSLINLQDEPLEMIALVLYV